MADFDLSKITGREPPTDDGLPCACEWNAAGEPVGLCAAHQSKLDDELAALRMASIGHRIPQPRSQQRQAVPRG